MTMGMQILLSLIIGKAEIFNIQMDGIIDEGFIFGDALTGTEIESIRAHGLAGER